MPSASARPATPGRVMNPFSTSDAPLVSRVLFSREIASWGLLPLSLAAIEGGVVGVLAKNIFVGAVPEETLNLAVAFLAGLPAIANLSSAVWTALSQGRHKIRFLLALKVATILLIASIALIPISAVGLVLLVFAVGGARTCWAGVVTLRSTVWRANYPRAVRASLAGRIAMLQAVALTVSVAALGTALDQDADAFRIFYPVVALLSLAGAWLYRTLRVRRHPALLRDELASTRSESASRQVFSLRTLLLQDDGFRRYMTCMFVFGSGNLMVTAPLVVVLKDRMGFGVGEAMWVTTAIPTLLMPFSIPFWSKLLDHRHIVSYRAIHSWAFVASIACILIGAVAIVPELIWLGAALKGVAFGGGVLGWNLGHHDFAPKAEASRYMGVHVTLTGMRGLVAPIIGISIYQLLEYASPGSGSWVFAFCLALSATGAIGFVLSRRSVKDLTGRQQPAPEGPPGGPIDLEEPPQRP